jgi:predicted ABC-type sugar transport system permease subunit
MVTIHQNYLNSVAEQLPPAMSLIIGVLNNGLDLLNVSAYWQTIIKGSIIVVAVIIDERKNR